MPSGSQRECMICLQWLSCSQFTAGQLCLAKSNSQCMRCEAQLLFTDVTGGRLRGKRKILQEIAESQQTATAAAGAGPEPQLRQETAAARRRGGAGRAAAASPLSSADDASQLLTAEDSGLPRKKRRRKTVSEGEEERVEEATARAAQQQQQQAAVAEREDDAVLTIRLRRLTRGDGDAQRSRDWERRTSWQRRAHRWKAEDGDGEDGGLPADASQHKRRRRRRRRADADERDELTGQDGAPLLHRRRAHSQHGQEAVDEAEDEAAQQLSRQRQHGRKKKKKKKSREQQEEEERVSLRSRVCLSPADNPYARVLLQPPIVAALSRSGRTAAQPPSSSSSPPPLPLQSDLLRLIRDSFGLTQRDELHPRVIHRSLVDAKYTQLMAATGTLRNGKVYVAVSGVSPSEDNLVDSDDEFAVQGMRRTRRRGRRAGREDWQPMLGLFAGCDFAKDEVVTCYGGSLITADSARRMPKLTRTHIRRVRDTQYVKDGRLFSALFDRRQVDMWEQFQMRSWQRKRIAPACQPEHLLKALSTEGHEDEVRFGLVLLDAQMRELPQLEALDRQELLTSIMRHVGEAVSVIDGEALREEAARRGGGGAEEERIIAAVGGPAIVVNLPSATFTSSSPNPYAGNSLSSSCSPLNASSSSSPSSLSVSHLFPFPVQPLHEPALLLHAQPEQRLTALMEFCQNLHKAARLSLLGVCNEVHDCMCSGGVGFMANTGNRDELNVKVLEVSSRKDGLLPNEVFYVAARAIAKHEEIIAPYKNSESRRRHLKVSSAQPAASADGEGRGEEAEAEGGEAAALSPSHSSRRTKCRRRRRRRVFTKAAAVAKASVTAGLRTAERAESRGGGRRRSSRRGQREDREGDAGDGAEHEGDDEEEGEAAEDEDDSGQMLAEHDGDVQETPLSMRSHAAAAGSGASASCPSPPSASPVPNSPGFDASTPSSSPSPSDATFASLSPTSPAVTSPSPLSSPPSSSSAAPPLSALNGCVLGLPSSSAPGSREHTLRQRPLCVKRQTRPKRAETELSSAHTGRQAGEAAMELEREAEEEQEERRRP